MITCIRLGILVSVAACASACGDDDDLTACQEEARTIAALADSSANGQTVFASSCGIGACHGSDGDSGPAPNLSTIAPGRSDTQLAEIVNCGAGNMPAQASLSDQQVADVVAYVQETFQ